MDRLPYVLMCSCLLWWVKLLFYHHWTLLHKISDLLSNCQYPKLVSLFSRYYGTGVPRYYGTRVPWDYGTPVPGYSGTTTDNRYRGTVGLRNRYSGTTVPRYSDTVRPRYPDTTVLWFRGTSRQRDKIWHILPLADKAAALSPRGVC